VFPFFVTMWRFVYRLRPCLKNMAEENRQFVLAARPEGALKESDLQLQVAPIPQIGDGEVLVKTEYISLDPSMKGQMENRSDYVAPLELGDVMRARAVGSIVASNHPDYAQGAQVFGYFGMQEFAVSDGKRIPFHVYEDPVDPPVAVGLLGGTGMTAYFGLLDIGQPVEGDTLVVSGAAGATGSIAGQIGKIKGCRVVGIAGSAEKCIWLTEELGFDHAINYKTDDIGAKLDEFCPQGIDVYFDNVGGEILDLCLARLAMNARVVLCGGISHYESNKPPGPSNYFNLVFRRARMEGFILVDFTDRFDEARDALRGWYDAGLLQQRATIMEGFEQLPNALVQLFKGANTGKMMVRV